MSKRLWGCLIVTLALAGEVSAAGFSIYEHGAAATATAGAFIARANDPTAIFYNAAGIAGQKMSVALGTTLIIPKTEFNGDNPFPGVGVTEKMKDALYYPSHAYLVAPIGPVTVGFGVFSPFGLGTEWPDAFSGRASSTKSVIQTFYFNPVVAYRLGPVSVGAGVQAVYGTVELARIARTPVLTEFKDVAKLSLEGTSSLAYGFNAGVQYCPIKQVVVGASYRSKAKCDFTGTAKFDSINANYALVKGKLPTETDVESSITFPAIMGVGVAVTPIPALTIEANVVQMQWSVFDSLGITFTDPAYASLGETIPEEYETARSYRIGAEYRINRSLVARIGYLYDESPAPDASVSTLLPDASRNSYMVGIGYTFGGATLDLSYMYLPFNDRSTNGQSRAGYNGLYKSSASLYGITLTYRF